jgi:hypothetical protein
MRSAASAARNSRQRCCWSFVSADTASATCPSCSSGVRPSGLRVVIPCRTWPLRPATRTIKNSSRLLAEIDRNRTRSSSGWLSLPDSSNTRRLNCNQDNSRLMRRSGLLTRSAGRTAATATATCARALAAGGGPKTSMLSAESTISLNTTRRTRRHLCFMSRRRWGRVKAQNGLRFPPQVPASPDAAVAAPRYRVRPRPRARPRTSVRSGS